MKEKLLSKQTAFLGAAGGFALYFLYRIFEIMIGLISGSHSFPNFAVFLYLLLTLAIGVIFALRKDTIVTGGLFAAAALIDLYWLFYDLYSMFRYISFGNFLGFVSSSVGFIAVAAMAAIAILTFIKPDFPLLKFWYAPAALYIIAILITFLVYIINIFNALTGSYFHFSYIFNMISFIIKSVLYFIGLFFAGRVFGAKN